MAFFYRRFFTPAPLLGLDIDHSAVRLVELTTSPDGQFHLARYAQQSLPEGAVADGHIQHPARLADCIAALAQSAGTRRKRVALALPAHAVMTRLMQVPADLTENALLSLLAEEAGRYLSVAPDDVRVDYQFVGDDDGGAQRDIVLIAARREQVEDRIAAVEGAGLIPVVLDIDLCAAHAACRQAVDTSALSALLMLGSCLIRLAVFDQHRLIFNRELSGCDMQTGLLQIATAATRAIGLATPSGMSVEQVFICGGGLAQDQLAQVMQAHSGLRCAAADPLSALCQDTDVAHRTAGATSDAATDLAAYATACGLAMRVAAQ